MSTSNEDRIPEDDETAEAPLTMAASAILTHLPKDASKALENAGDSLPQKGMCLQAATIATRLDVTVESEFTMLLSFLIARFIRLRQLNLGSMANYTVHLHLIFFLTSFLHSVLPFPFRQSAALTSRQ